MGSIDEIMQVCRLCLVKDKVNIPIFDESNNSEEIFNKICSCLPVKVSREDNLPKKICDGCSYKLELLYTFRNTSVDSEKQLMSLLNQAGLSACSLNSTLVRDATKPEVLVKQETLEPADSRMENENSDVCPDAQSYIMQQQQLPYQQDFAFAEASGSSEVPTEEPPPKRARRSNPVKKPPVQTDSEDEDLDLAMQITKAEDEDSDDVDQPDYVEPSTSADDQPGPSGVGKDVVEAPKQRAVKQTRKKRGISKTEKGRKGVEEHKKGMKSCPNCAKTFSDNRKLKRHLIVHSDERPFPCDLCPKRFKRKEELNVHTKCHGGKLKYECDICERILRSQGALLLHKRRHLKEYVVTCDPCGKGFVTNQEYFRHMSAKHGKSCFVCHICGKGCYDKAALQSHINTHAENYRDNKFACNLCDKTFLQESYLKLHFGRIHKNGGRKFACDKCGKIVRSKRSLRDHIFMHEGKKPLECKTCGKTFTLKTTLKAHSRTHTGDRPYVCTSCGKAFTQRTSLTIHMRYHSGERPYICDICQDGFVSRALLNVHLKSKHRKLMFPE